MPQPREQLPLRLRKPQVLGLLTLLVLAALVFASGQGAYAIDAARLPGVAWQAWLHWWNGTGEASTEQLVFATIRLPRLVMGLAAGAGLGLAGALMQGLFRNPLADPGLIGVSSGAALAAAALIVLGALWFPQLPRTLGSWPLMLTAFAGGLAVVALIYGLAQAGGGTRIGVMLLAGVAINALAMAGLGLLSFLSTDEQLRNLQLWLLGSLGGTRWPVALGAAALVATAVLLAQRLAQPLNAIALGEAQASLLGVAVEPTKRCAVVLAALVVGAITAACGMIGFIGLVAPHWVRLMAGPDHRVVLPASALLGAAMVVFADAFARTIVQPAELPLGVLTALVGVPLFLAMLRQFRRQL
ncbi:MAG: FecCD family ABC transporter permease [Comamonas sp.]